MAKRLETGRPLAYPATRLRYPTPVEMVGQTEIFLELNGKRRRGFRPSDIPEIPVFRPSDPGALLVLAVYFDSLERTFNNWWDFIEPPPGMTKRRIKGLKTGPEDLRLVPGTNYRPGIRWIEFNPNANRGMTADDAIVRSSTEGTTLAHVEVLMAAAQHRKWVMSWNGRESFYPNMSGLQIRSYAGWSDTAFLNNWSATNQSLLTIGIWGAGSKLWSRYWGSPTVCDIEC